MDPEDNGIHLPGAHGQPVEAPEQGLNEDALNPVRVEEPPQAAPDAQMILRERNGRRQRRLMDQFLCNLCRRGALGAVVPMCGHVFCWACLWPHMAGRRNPQCPRCQYPLFPNHIVPIYGRPDDGENVAEPGAVPRPAGIYVEHVDPFAPFLPQGLDPGYANFCPPDAEFIDNLFYFSFGALIVLVIFLIYMEFQILYVRS